MVEAMKLFAFLVAGAVFATQPAAAASKPELVPLEQQLAALASAQPTELGFAAYDLGSDSIAPTDWLCDSRDGLISPLDD